jgi:hypothetical protein
MKRNDMQHDTCTKGPYYYERQQHVEGDVRITSFPRESPEETESARPSAFIKSVQELRNESKT